MMSASRKTDDNLYYVIDHTNVTGTSGIASTYLGRPWGSYARVIFQNSELGSVMCVEGLLYVRDDAESPFLSQIEIQPAGLAGLQRKFHLVIFLVILRISADQTIPNSSDPKYVLHLTFTLLSFTSTPIAPNMLHLPSISEFWSSHEPLYRY